MQVLKLDLHTHIYEATNCKNPTRQLVEDLIGIGRNKGLDGIAVTEHWDLEYGKRFLEIKEEYFASVDFIFMAGREIEVGKSHIVELMLSKDVWLKFLAHPGFSPVIRDGIKGIELRNGMHTFLEYPILQAAEAHGLVLLENSDAHYLEDIGRHATTVIRDSKEDIWFLEGTKGQKYRFGARNKAG